MSDGKPEKLKLSRRDALKAAAEIVRLLDKLIAGEIDQPLAGNRQIPATSDVYTKLEELRGAMLAGRIENEERIGTFNDTIAGVAHDMKTPLAVISGYAECIQDGIDDKDYASLIIEKAREMRDQVSAMVEDVRAKQAERTRAIVEAGAFFTKVFEELKIAAQAKRIKLIFRKAPKASLYIDAEHIARVCQNLVGNAIKATQEGGRILVRFGISSGKYYVKIIDNGAGIAKADRKHIFDKFFTTDKARTKNSGLGLYLCKEFIEYHGGEITFRSRTGKGIWFMFTLPIVAEEAKLPSTLRFEKHNKPFKLVIVFLFGFIMPFMFRLVKAFETNSISSMFGAAIALPFFLIFWFVDFVSELVYDKITFLAD